MAHDVAYLIGGQVLFEQIGFGQDFRDGEELERFVIPRIVGVVREERVQHVDLEAPLLGVEDGQAFLDAQGLKLNGLEEIVFGKAFVERLYESSLVGGIEVGGKPSEKKAVNLSVQDALDGSQERLTGEAGRGPAYAMGK